jgi:hypothetical protein
MGWQRRALGACRHRQPHQLTAYENSMSRKGYWGERVRDGVVADPVSHHRPSSDSHGHSATAVTVPSVAKPPANVTLDCVFLGWLAHTAVVHNGGGGTCAPRHMGVHVTCVHLQGVGLTLHLAALVWQWQLTLRVARRATFARGAGVTRSPVPACSAHVERRRCGRVKGRERAWVCAMWSVAARDRANTAVCAAPAGPSALPGGPCGPCGPLPPLGPESSRSVNQGAGGCAGAAGATHTHTCTSPPRTLGSEKAGLSRGARRARAARVAGDAVGAGRPLRPVGALWAANTDGTGSAVAASAA